MGRVATTLAWAFIGTYLLLAVVVPFLTVAWVSLLPFYRPVSLDAMKLLSLSHYSGLLTPALWDAVRNSIILSVAAPTLTVFFSLTISWIITRYRGIPGRWFEIIAFLPLSIPSVIFAVGAILIALKFGSLVPIYGTIWLIVLVEFVVRMTTATRITNSAMLQIHNELDEAGSVFGLSPAMRFLRILLPLLLPAIVYCWFFLALLAFRDLSVPVLLVSPKNVTLSVHIWGLLGFGSYGRASALTILVLLSIIGVGFLAAVASRIASRIRLAGVLQ
jgi:iron(III) transport system permease protein